MECRCWGRRRDFVRRCRLCLQIVKIWKQGGRDVSYAMLTFFLVGVLLWFVYGVVVKAEAVIITNLATAVLITRSLRLG